MVARTQTIAEPQVDVGIAEQDRTPVIKALETLLADEFALYVKTRKYHWNVLGHLFPSLHPLFEDQYKTLDRIIDHVAERIRALGDVSPGTLREFVEAARLRETPGENPDALEMVRSLLRDQESVVKSLRAAIDLCDEHRDHGTSNFLQDLIVRHEKMAWMLRATAAE